MIIQEEAIGYMLFTIYYYWTFKARKYVIR